MGWLPSPLREEKETRVASHWTRWSSSRTTRYPGKRGSTPEALQCEDAGAGLVCCGATSPERKDTASSPHVVEDYRRRRRITSPERRDTGQLTTRGGGPQHAEDHLTRRKTTAHGGGPSPLSAGTRPAHYTWWRITAQGGGPLHAEEDHPMWRRITSPERRDTG